MEATVKLLLAVFLAAGTLLFSNVSSVPIKERKPVYTFGSNTSSLPMIVSMVCTVNQSIDEVEVRWSHDGVIYTSNENNTNERLSVLNSSSSNNISFITTLVIRPAMYSDNGTYYCQVRDKGNSSLDWMSARTNLHLLVHLYTNHPTVNSTTTSPAAELSCDMAGYVPPQSFLRWYRNGVQLTNSGRYSIVYRNGLRMAQKNGSNETSRSILGVLVISPPMIQDSGQYQCRVQGYHYLTRSVRLTVKNDATNDSSSTSTVSPAVSASLVDPFQSSPTAPPSAPPTGSPTGSPTSGGSSDSSGLFGNKWLLLTFAIVAATLALMAVTAALILICVCLCNVSDKRKRKGGGGVDEDGQELNEGHYDMIQDGTGLNTDPKELVSYDSVAEAFYPTLPLPTVHFIQSSLPPLSPLFSNYEEPVTITGSKPNSMERSGNHGNNGDHGKTFSFNPYEDNFDLNEGPPLPPPRSRRRSSLPPVPPASTADFDHIYTEVLEPSMLHGNQAPPPSNEKALPYAPIFEAGSNLLTRQLFHIPPQCLQILEELGHGRFGKIFLAGTVNVSLKDLKLNEDTNKNKSILVAMKQLKPEASSELRDAFNQEIKFMSHLQHANVVRLLAVSLTGSSPFIVIEYMENGDLHQYLRQLELQPNSATLSSNHISPVILLYITVQIASGMRYLANKRFVHRDLAARNILVGRDFVTKISDFGMSRSLYESSYYCIAGQLILPIRWMSTETYYGQFSVKSDSWAFGVTVWEVFMLCCSLPYSHLQDDEVIADAIKGEEREVLQKPESCPSEVYAIMRRCFVHSPQVRADFEEIYSRLFVIYKKIVEEIR